jgi:AhpD family alkylhydroperoxidase
MRLPEIERGDGFANRLLIRFISMVSGMRLPDAARVAFYHKDFFGAPIGAWTQAAMRGPSSWSVAERELMACMVAKWNACAFCVGAHGAVAAKEMQRPAVDAVIADFRTPQVSFDVPRDHDAAPQGFEGRACKSRAQRGRKPPGSD